MSELPDAQYWTSDGDRVHCHLCPHQCRIAPGRTGTCGVRENHGGTLSLPLYGAVSSLAIDPIEKKPLYHYHPGERVFSVGFLGCNLHCPFCQNYQISQNTHRSAHSTSPQALIEQAADSGAFGIAYTYNEPTIHVEFVKDAAELARTAGLKNVLVTNGHLLEKPARDLLSLIDAANIDLKSFNRNTYRSELGGDLATVQDFIATAMEFCHVELTTLLIPEFNDSESELKSLSSFVSKLGPNIPLHISAYYPTYKYTQRATTEAEVDRAVRIARERLTYVYSGNVSSPSSTPCPSCGSVLIERRGYHTSTPGLSGSKCASCGAPAPVVMD